MKLLATPTSMISSHYDEINPSFEPPPLKPSLNSTSQMKPTGTMGAKRPSQHRMACLSVVVCFVLVCACVSLAVATWSAVEVWGHSNNFANLEQESLQAQLKSLQRTVDSHTNVFSGQFPSIPASSCLQVSLVSSSSPSGYYWVRASNGSAVRVYCDMTRSCGGVTGGWMRVAYLQFENGSDSCPDGFRERRVSGIRTCVSNSIDRGCFPIPFDTFDIPYGRVCGKILAYQHGSVDCFAMFSLRRSQSPLSVDSNYVDGVSLTHGRSPRKHIWTFAAANFGGDLEYYCPCSLPAGQSPLSPTPAFIGQDYFCESGAQSRSRVDGFYVDDPLWDGENCPDESTCCELNNPPWFQKQLPQVTTDNIEMRVCRDQDQDDEDIPLAHVEIYVQ